MKRVKMAGVSGGEADAPGVGMPLDRGRGGPPQSLAEVTLTELYALIAHPVYSGALRTADIHGSGAVSSIQRLD